MSSEFTFRNLRYVLATIYDDEVSGRRIARDAGLNVMNIAFSGRAIDNWQAILTEAHKVAKFNALLAIVLGEYDSNQQLRDAYDAYVRDPNKVTPLNPLLTQATDDDAPAEGDPPFKGLTFFDVPDAAIFFGRERVISQLVAHLRQEHFLAVVGASGSGKSSLVRAGLVPAILKGQLGIAATLQANVEPWPVHIITPTSEPLESLADTLTRNHPSVTLMDAMIDDMGKNPRSLHRHIKRWLDKYHPAADGLLLVVDQFEELFTLCRDRTKQRHFVDNLMAAMNADSPTRLVITLRADFYAHCAQFNDLRQALARDQLYIGPMEQEELRHAITEPAYRQGWEFEPGLVDLLLDDIGHEPGSLPLLSHALLETWRRRRGRTMTLAGYVGSGRVHGAIAQTAEKIFTQNLKPTEQNIAKNIFLRLTELGEGTEDTRRRIKTAEVISISDMQSAVENVLKVLADARLITTHEQDAEVAHEALIREWPRLRGWLEADRYSLRTHRHITDTAEGWKLLQRDAGALYRGIRLQQALEWAAENASNLNQLETEFLRASRAAVEQDIREKELVRQRDAEQQRAINSRQRVIIGVVTIALMLAIIGGYFLNEQRKEIAGQKTNIEQNAEVLRRSNDTLQNQSEDLQQALLSEETARTTAEARRIDARNAQAEAERQSKISLSRQLSAQAVSSIEQKQDIELGLLLAVEAARTSYEAGEQEVLQILESLRGAILAAPGKIFRYEGDLLANQQLLEARVSDIKEIYASEQPTDIMNGFIEMPYLSEARPLGLDFSSDGSRLALIYPDHTVRLIDILNDIQIGILYHSADVIRVRFSPDMKRIATSTRDNSVHLWDPINSKEIAHIYHTDRIRDIDFSPDSSRLATAGEDGIARLINANSGREIASVIHTQDVWDIDFSPDSTNLATASEDSTAYLIDSSRGEIIYTFAHRNSLTDIDFSPDGKYLATASFDGNARIWDRMTGQDVFTYEVFGKAWSLEFSPDSKRLAVATTSVDIWEIGNTKEPVQLVHGTEVRSVIFSSDGSRLATFTDGDTAYIWDSISGTVLAKSEHNTWVKAIAFSQDGHHFVDASDDRVVRLWDSASGEELNALLHRSGVTSVAFHPVSNLLATSSDSDSSRLYSTLDINEPIIIPYSPDTYEPEWDSVLYDVLKAVGISLPEINIYSNDSVANLKDGIIALTNEAGAKSTVSLVDKENNREIATLLFDKDIRAISFDQTGKHLITVSEKDDTFQIWQSLWWAKTEELVSQACEILSRNLTIEEWQTYIGDGNTYRSTCSDMSWIHQ